MFGWWTLLSASMSDAHAVTAPTVELASRSGLSVRLGDVPAVRGSWFQVYEPDWSKGYYGSMNADQKIDQDGTTTVANFSDRSERVSGEQRVTRDGNTVTVRTTFTWTGANPVNVEFTAGMLWQPLLQGTEPPKFDGAPGQYFAQAPKGNTMDSRRIGPEAQVMELPSKLGLIRVEHSLPMTAFDARGYAQGWAENDALIWIGAGGIRLTPNEPRVITSKWTFPSVESARKALAPARLTPSRAESTGPANELPILVPKPKLNQLDLSKPTALGGRFSLPGGRFRFLDSLYAALDRRYDGWRDRGDVFTLIGGTSKMGLAPGGYRIIIKPGEASVIGQDEEGLRTALERLALLAYIRDGKLVLPTGTLIDEPRRNFRGVHLFVGPKARPFHQRLWTRVLRPLGLNRVVLQCERTDWQAIPGTKTAITMPRGELKALFDWYRAQQIEPTPLIQSFGHMEWLFANNQNLDLAFNRNVPYAIDPRQPAARAKIEAIWDEAVTLLNPSALHFGLDEVDMRGFPEDPALVTALWKESLGHLSTIAKRHGKPMMLWGDKGLAPGEAIDAAHGDTPEHAAARRAAIPQGAIVTDWHYRNDPDPAKFVGVLELWRKSGQEPIASMWFRENNIRGFTLAADRMKAGTLITTWAGYESNEDALRRHFNQFSAMILSADYSWSGRQEAVADLGYSPTDLFRRMYFDAPVLLNATTVGDRWTTEPKARAGTVLDGEQPRSIRVSALRPGARVAVRLNTAYAAAQGEVVAELVVRANGKAVRTVPIQYGRHIVAQDDLRMPTEVRGRAQVCEVVLALPATGAIELEIVPKNPVVDVRYFGISETQRAAR
ncbi:MAG: hypothetical protein SFX74_11380 [Fimbriimonadaceae bacterium]|nr:hypothetical protein [Fimbriimonadaceae bacterium]